MKTRYCIHGIFGILGAALMIVGTTTSPARAQNLLTNGSFENGAFGNPPQGYNSLPSGSTSITGWTVYNDQIAWITTPNFTPLTAQDGTKFLDMQDPGFAGAPYGWVTQTIATTVGQPYQLTFYIGVLEDNSFDPNLGGPVTIRASAGATSMDFTYAPPPLPTTQWMSFSLNFTGASASTAISLLGIGGENFLGVDNASVIAVPEASSAVLLFAGAIGASLGRRRCSFARQRKKSKNPGLGWGCNSPQC
jgi:hypothetical protein